MIQRIGVLTGGGDCPGLNAVIRAVVKTALTQYGWRVIGIEDGFEGLVFNHTRPLKLEDVRGLLPRGGTILGTTNRGNPFSMRVPRGDQFETRDVSDQVVANFRALELDALIVIGGDGSLKIAHELIAKGLPIVGVPKTIDNDLMGTDATFGFDTALATATDAIDKLHTTAESHHRIMLVEVMGRNAGWIALEAGIAGSADAILIPEIPFRYESLEAMIARRERTGRKFSIIVVAEGAMPVGGAEVYQSPAREGQLARLGGIGATVALELERRTDREARTLVLGHLQRGGSPSAFDRLLATRFGAAAVHLVANRDFGKMVALHGWRVASFPIADAISKLKRVPADGELVRAARDMGIVFGDEV
jgi:6-phosphofructokinase 1